MCLSKRSEESTTNARVVQPALYKINYKKKREAATYECMPLKINPGSEIFRAWIFLSLKGNSNQFLLPCYSPPDSNG